MDQLFVGKIVRYMPGSGDFGTLEYTYTMPLAAIITHVWGERLVNLAVFDREGATHPRRCVSYYPENEWHPEDTYCAAL